MCVGSGFSPEGRLAGAARLQTVGLQDVADPQALSLWLEVRGVATADWGTGTSKCVAQLWKELQLSEASLEVWRTEEGEVQVVRATHVLRGKVHSANQCSAFLCNTSQQFADGRMRERNALLTEKLSIAELPLEEHLHEVCKRAVSEEMHEIVDESFRIGQLGCSTPKNEVVEPTVLDEQYVDCKLEVEPSKSYPGLLTVYHLYTVDIVCSCLPPVDFKTLEFTRDASGCQQLKYVHAWSWVDERTFQMYQSASPSAKPAHGPAHVELAPVPFGEVHGISAPTDCNSMVMYAQVSLQAIWTRFAGAFKAITSLLHAL